MNPRDWRIGCGRGFVSQAGRVYVMRCPECERENVLTAVATGECAHCGHRPTVTDADLVKAKQHV